MHSYAEAKGAANTVAGERTVRDKGEMVTSGVDASLESTVEVGFSEVSEAKKAVDDAKRKEQELKKVADGLFDELRKAGSGEKDEVEKKKGECERRIVQEGQELESVQQEYVEAYQRYTACVESYIATPARDAKNARLKAEYATEFYFNKHFNVSMAISKDGHFTMRKIIKSYRKKTK